MGKSINVSNMHLAEIEEQDGALIFGTPERIPGIRKANRKPNVATGQQYGDGKLEEEESAKTSYAIALDHNNIPLKWRAYMEGTVIENGVESGKSTDKPKPFAMGWEIEKTKGVKELVWFIYCKVSPIEDTDEQREGDNLNISNDTLVITAFEHDSIGRYYTKINSAHEDVTETMVEDFFKVVQITDEIKES
jgi:phi13 family phage major tail protein